MLRIKTSLMAEAPTIAKTAGELVLKREPSQGTYGFAYHAFRKVRCLLNFAGNGLPGKQGMRICKTLRSRSSHLPFDVANERKRSSVALLHMVSGKAGWF